MKPTLPPNARETTLSFEKPGEICITNGTEPPVSVNLEETWPKLSFTAYDKEAVQEWEAVFLRLAAKCHEISGRY